LGGCRNEDGAGSGGSWWFPLFCFLLGGVVGVAAVLRAFSGEQFSAASPQRSVVKRGRLVAAISE